MSAKKPKDGPRSTHLNRPNDNDVTVLDSDEDAEEDADTDAVVLSVKLADEDIDVLSLTLKELVRDVVKDEV